MLALAMTNDVTAQGLKGTDSIMWAIVNVSCCNLRTSGDYDAGMETQGLLGMPLRILENMVRSRDSRRHAGMGLEIIVAISH